MHAWQTRSTPEPLDLTHRHDANLVCWKRRLPAGIGRELTTWARCFPAHFDEVLSLEQHDLSAAVAGVEPPLRDWLRLDILELLTRFSTLAGTSRLRVSFGAIRSDQCTKFHVDYVRLRLITTYAGPGTEWLPEDAVHRSALERPIACPREANQLIVRREDAVRRARPGEVLVMQGALGPAQRGVVHRSPPIEASGRVRVVLRANTVDP